MKYRSRIAIAAIMLETAIRGATKTRLMYASFTSYEQVTDYLKVLMTNGLIEQVKDSTKNFKTTKKGIEFLNLSRSLNELMPLEMAS